MTVIALTQEMGSLAKDVADQLAADARPAVDAPRGGRRTSPSRMHVPTSLISRLREGKAGHARAPARRQGEHGRLHRPRKCSTLAARGNVVLRGWGATCLLRAGAARRLRARHAAVRAARRAGCMEHLETDDVAFAEDEIRRSDRAHAARMHAQFGVDLGRSAALRPRPQHRRVSVESCVAADRRAGARARVRRDRRPRARMLQNLALEARVRAALRADDATRDIDVTVDSDAGAHRPRAASCSTLTRCRAAERRGRGGRRASAAVDNQLRVMARSRLVPVGADP